MHITHCFILTLLQLNERGYYILKIPFNISNIKLLVSKIKPSEKSTLNP